MARLTGPLRGFGVLAETWTASRLDEGESSYTEAGPQPGGSVPAGSAPGRLQVQALQAQAEDAVLGVVHGGYPGRGREGAQIRYRLEGDASTDDRGWETPIRLTGWRGAFGAPLDTDSADAAAWPVSGRVLVAYGDQVAVWSPYTGLLEDSATLSGAEQVAVAAVPGEVGHAVAIDGASGWYTSDHGATWASDTASPVDTDYATVGGYAVQSPRVAFDVAGSCAFLAYDTSAAAWKVWASSDRGQVWEEVDTALAHAVYDLRRLASGALLYLYVDASDDVYAARVGSAYTAPDDALDTVQVNATGAYDRAFAYVDHDGVVWAYLVTDADDDTEVWVSLDEGTTWAEVATIDWTGDADQRPRAMALAPSMGQAVGLVSWGSYSAAGGRLGLATLGGWASPGWARAKELGQSSRRLQAWGAHTISWCAGFEPQNGGWTANGAGSADNSSGALELSVANNSDTRYYSITADASPSAGAAWSADLEVAVDDDAGGTTTHLLRVLLDDGTDRYQVSVVLFEDGIRVYDDTAAAFLGTKQGPDLTSPKRLRISFRDGDLEIRYLDPFDPLATTWSAALTWSGATAASSSSATCDVDFGIYYNNSSGATARWRIVALDVGNQSPAFDTDPQNAKALGPLGYPIPDLCDTDAEVVCYVRAEAGPGIRDESYTLDASRAYAVEHAYPDAYPGGATSWRADTDTADQDLVVDATHDRRPGWGPSLALVVRGARSRTWQVATKADGGSWTLRGSLDLAEGHSACRYQLNGSVLRPDTTDGSTAPSRYIRAGELVGGHVVLDYAGTPLVRRIRSNTAGVWGPSSRVSLQASITLESADLDGTELSSGVLRIVWPAGVLVLHLDQVEARHWRVRGAATGTEAVGGQIGADSVGLYSLAVPGKQWGHGYEVERAPNSAASRDPWGTERRRRLGPGRRVVSVSWDHGAKESRIRGDASSVDYVGDASGEPLAARDDVRGILEAMLVEAEEGARPVLLLAQDPGHGETLLDPTLWLEGYLDGSVRSTIASGGEGTDEYLRSGPVRVVEIV